MYLAQYLAHNCSKHVRCCLYHPSKCMEVFPFLNSQCNLCMHLKTNSYLSSAETFCVFQHRLLSSLKFPELCLEHGRNLIYILKFNQTKTGYIHLSISRLENLKNNNFNCLLQINNFTLRAFKT